MECGRTLRRIPSGLERGRELQVHSELTVCVSKDEGLVDRPKMMALRFARYDLIYLMRVDVVFYVVT